MICRPEDAAALASVGENFRPVPETAGNYSLAEQVKIPLALRREGVTLFHAPHYVLPPLVGCRSVVTIHDCIHLMFPQYLPNRLALAFARNSIAVAARRAVRVLTVSESSKRDILRFVDVPPDKIDVIYNAVARFSVQPSEEHVVSTRERYQLSPSYLLYVGNIKPHKNLERLIEAFDLVRARGLAHLKLVLIGDEISRYAALRRAVHQHHLHKHVRFLGYMSQETLANHVSARRRLHRALEASGCRRSGRWRRHQVVTSNVVAARSRRCGRCDLRPGGHRRRDHRVLTDRALRCGLRQRPRPRASSRGKRRSAASAKSTVR